MIPRVLVLLLLLVLVPAPAAAGTGGEIAYSLRGGREIYLVDPDGSGKRLLYRAPAKKTLFALDIIHDGGQLSFEEVDSSGQTATLKTISYGESGLGTVIRTVSGGRFQMDTARDGSLLFVEFFTGDVRLSAPGSSSSVSVGVPRQASKVAWLADGSFLYASEGQVWRATLANPAGTSLIGRDCVQSLSAAHVALEALVDTGQACGDPGLYRLFVDPPSIGASIAQGDSAAYSPDDACFIHIAPAQRGSYLMIRRLDGDGNPVQVGAKANYASVDWRGDSSPDPCPVPSLSPFRFRTP